MIDRGLSIDAVGDFKISQASSDFAKLGLRGRLLSDFSHIPFDRSIGLLEPIFAEPLFTWVVFGGSSFGGLASIMILYINPTIIQKSKYCSDFEIILYRIEAVRRAARRF